ncbi:potassium transporter [Frankia sp. CcI49]|uniref:Trk system potassium uptake protein TrkA n=1 Tax=Parafrankia irregularis TaxID=795642 RepID=A0A0S4QVJ2_9ACTN|nr:MULTISPECIES: TrkA family potassium uptake protein [Frankiaceae]KPM52148.1 potassium transporter [Frankia sp. R43]MBE3200013.1 TrkA family potassium uptake protein [Parafrankia sp. CH37]ONH51685.1 potassium transporter [Frankia sp. CcI49]CUU59241.1 trk system potassium uptake protein TrkA [Parafrankia irregularis]
MASRNREDAVLVIGLGRFGGTLAQTLQELGHRVVAVDRNHDLVQQWSGQITHVIEADATSEVVMRQLGAHEFRRAVVAIGTEIEASVLATGVLLDLAVPEVWSKAITREHGRILERIGANHVVYPERDAGERVAHLMTGRLIDFLEFDDNYAIAKLRAPREICGRALEKTALRSRFGITIVGVKHPGGQFTHAEAGTVLGPGDLIMIAGGTDRVEEFATAVGTANPP